MVQRVVFAALFALVGCVGWMRSAAAQMVGKAHEWQMGMQTAASPVAERIHAMNHFLEIIITAIVLLVLAILAYVIVRFNAKRNPVPSKTAHNTLIEIIWTAAPVAILVVIAIPSIKLLYYEDTTKDHQLTLKVTGHQWYWTYTYPDQGGFSFDSIPIPESDLQPGQPRLLTVDNAVVVPVGASVQVLATSEDVIHNWAIPSLGLKKDATPGRVNETWFRADHEGVYYGMCSELCGVNHYFMPIVVKAVTPEAFDAWVKDAQQKFAKADGTAVEVVARNEAAAGSR